MLGAEVRVFAGHFQRSVANPFRYQITVRTGLLGGARAILATATGGDAMGPLVSGLSARGKFIVVGVPQEPIQLNAFPLVFGGRSVHGSLTGTPIDGEDTLAFSVLENIRPMIETAPLEQAADGYARMMQGKARFRMVLVTTRAA
jgi:propanol-preferring alcohol dehydrogenase